MRLVTYDRGGARRLGAWVEEAVVDLHDAVGHPAFPTTMETLVSTCGGTTLDAARHALGRPDYLEDCFVSRPRLLVPILPAPIPDLPSTDGLEKRARRGGPDHHPRTGARDGRESAVPLAFFGPGETVPVPAEAAMDYEVELACVLGRGGRTLSPAEASRIVFGFTLVLGWTLVDGDGRGDRRGPSGHVGASLGPTVVTADELDPLAAQLVVRVDSEEWSRGRMADARSTFPDLIAHLSEDQELYPGDIVGSGTFPGGTGRDAGRRLEPGAVVEASVEGIGTLRARVGSPGEAGPPLTARPGHEVLRAIGGPSGRRPRLLRPTSPA